MPVVPRVDRIAVLRASWLGDLVLALPALAALRVAYPGAEITYLGAPWHPELLDGRPGPWDRVVVVPPYPGVPDGRARSRDTPEAHTFLAERRRQRYDLAVQLHGGGGSNPLVAALGARVSVGARDSGALPLDRWLSYTGTQHEVLRCLEVVELVGAEPVGLAPRLAGVPGDAALADAALADAVLPPGTGRLVALHPGARDPRRRWPPESFAAVADALAAEGTVPVLVGRGADDRAAADAVLRAARSPVMDLVDRLSLPGLVGVLDRCCLVVADDSGPRHLAEALGTPTVGIFLERNLLNAGPLLRRRHRVSVASGATCPVCGADETRARCGHDASLVAGIAVPEVLAHALDLLREEGDADRAAARAG